MKINKLSSLLLLLIMVICIAFTGCGNQVDNESKTDVNSTVVSNDAQNIYTADTELGQGSKTVYVNVTDNQNKTITFTIHTDKEFLGDALIDNGIIKGDEGQYGLYVTHVNGLEANYDTDKAYWGFFQNGEYMMSGVDTTKFSDGDSYELVYVKE
ncbi:MAG: DUF4430 domain-containing protein [Clostridia bacterium]|nr:DUF4430 domain-containing protein [Clostridia bacterium]